MNNKGGVLKTTIATNLASLLANHHKKVLLIYLDAQANVSLSFGINPDQFKYTISDVLINKLDIEQAINKQIIKNLDLCPANTKLTNFIGHKSLSLLSIKERQNVLHKVLQKVLLKYDYIIIDSSPHLDLLTQNIIVASDEILIPLQMEVLAARGLINLTNEINQLKGKIRAIIPTLFDERTIIHKDILQQIIKIAHDLNIFVTKTKITKSIKAANANAYHRVPLVLTTTKGKWVQQYANIAEELDYGIKGVKNEKTAKVF